MCRGVKRAPPRNASVENTNTSTRKKTKQSEDSKSTASSADTSASLPTLPFKKSTYVTPVRRPKTLKQISELTAPGWTYWSLVVPPSRLPRRRYCDVTGLPGIYTEPRTGMRYYGAEVYQMVRGMEPDAVQRFLKIRNAHTIVK